MITINLAPKEYREKLDKKKIYVSIKEAMLIILLFSSIASILLIISKFYLDGQLIDLTNQNSQGIAMVQITNAKVELINEKINQAYGIQQSYIPWSLPLSDIYAQKGESISISSLKILKSQASIDMVGVAKTRDELISFQKRLQKIGYFKKVNLPISDLINKENNGFNIRIDLDLPKL